MRIRKLEDIRRHLPAHPGIQGKEEYFNSVVLLLLIPVDDEYHFVFQKRCPDIRQGGEICLPGGKYDPEKDLSLEMTAIRETSEELGIPGNMMRIIGRLDTVIAPMGATVDVFVGTSDVLLEEFKINTEEVEKVFSIPVSWFEQNSPEEYQVMLKVFPSYIDETTQQEIILLPSEALGLPEQYRKPWGGFKHKVFVYKTSEGIIWGITARVILDFVRRINQSSEY